MTRTAVYKHYDAAGLLLYVGVAADPYSRDRQHRRDSPWYHHIASTSVVWFETREEALAVERKTIVQERPLHNFLHSTSHHQGELNDFIYLIGRSEFEQFVGISPQVVSRALKENAMPCHWYMRVKALCAEIGIECPDHLFKWLSAPEGDA